MIDFTTISYLKAGNLRQRSAYVVLSENRIFDILKDFDPLLAGTIPIGIDTVESDLDIICFCNDELTFKEIIIRHYSSYRDFKIRDLLINGQPATVANFYADDFEIEIFGQNIPVKSQLAYRHMVVEYQLLQEKGDAFQKEIVKLKRQGYKTEPAFAKLLELKGDPYQELLKFENT